MKPPISIIILTQDEEANLADCLASVADFDDVHVLDSGSTDRTPAIARERGVPVHFQEFRGFGQQRNWAIDYIPTRYPWQFHLDADERMVPELVTEMTEAVKADPSVGGFLVPSKLMFAGRWLRYAGDYPTYQVRLFHRERLRFVDHGHGQREQTTYPLGRLQQPYLHLAFSKGLDHWFAKHALYARREAEQALGVSDSSALGTPVDGGSLFSTDPTRRRRALKRLTTRLPLRYLWRLGYLLILRRAFLDGAAGIAYAFMMAAYEGMIEVHLRLLRARLRA